MGPLGAIIASFLVTDIGAAMTRLKRNSIFWAIIGLFGLTTYVFAMVAGTLYLAQPPRFTLLEAVLIMGGATLLLCIVLAIIMASLDARDRRIALLRRQKAQLPTNIAVATSMTLLRKKPLMAAGMAVAAGVALSFLKRSSDD